jgi:hypothetical protein
VPRPRKNVSGVSGGGEGGGLLTFADVQVYNQRAERISQGGRGVDFGGNTSRRAVLCFASAWTSVRVK